MPGIGRPGKDGTTEKGDIDMEEYAYSQRKRTFNVDDGAHVVVFKHQITSPPMIAQPSTANNRMAHRRLHPHEPFTPAILEEDEILATEIKRNVALSPESMKRRDISAWFRDKKNMVGFIQVYHIGFVDRPDLVDKSVRKCIVDHLIVGYELFRVIKAG